MVRTGLSPLVGQRWRWVGQRLRWAGRRLRWRHRSSGCRNLHGRGWDGGRGRRNSCSSCPDQRSGGGMAVATNLWIAVAVGLAGWVLDALISAWAALLAM